MSCLGKKSSEDSIAQRASHVFDCSRASIIGHQILQHEKGAIFAVNDGMFMLSNVIVGGIILLFS
jgi:hypothetical protein